MCWLHDKHWASNCAGAGWCKPYVQTGGRWNTGLKVAGERILFIRPDQIWVHRGWTLNLPSGSESSARLSWGKINTRQHALPFQIQQLTLFFQIPFRAVQVPLVTWGLQARMGLLDPLVALVLLAVQDLLEQEVSLAHLVKKGHQAHEEKG